MQLLGSNKRQQLENRISAGNEWDTVTNFQASLTLLELSSRAQSEPVLVTALHNDNLPPTGRKANLTQDTKRPQWLPPSNEDGLNRDKFTTYPSSPFLFLSKNLSYSFTHPQLFQPSHSRVTDFMIEMTTE